MRSLTPELIKFYRESRKKYFHNIKEEDKQKIVASLYVIFTLVTVSFFGIFAIQPTLSTISNLRKQYDDNMIVYNALREKLTALQQLDVQHQQIEQNLELMYLAIPTSPKIAYLTRQLESLARSNGVSLRKLDFGTVEIYPARKKVPPLFSFSVNMIAEGDQTNINTFLTQLTNFDRLIKIDRIVTAKSSNEGNAFQATIVANVFFYDQ